MDDRSLVPRLGILGVLGLATLLIGVVVLRPKDTHSNLWNEVREGYTRTEVGLVAADGQTAIAQVGGATMEAAMSLQAPIWLMVPEGQVSSRLTDPGQRLYSAVGCAKCHGMDGRGGVVGPSLAGRDPQVIAAMARLGPGGMPAFSADMLSDSDLAQIGAYLQPLGRRAPARAAGPSPAPAVIAAPAPAEKPAASPAATPAPTPAPAPAPPTPAAGTSAPTPTSTPAPPPTPTPAPSLTGDPARGMTAYAGKCAACHGANAGGAYGPALTGLDPGAMKKTVRQGKGGMPALGPSIIKDQELDDILAYIHSLTAGGGRQ